MTTGPTTRLSLALLVPVALLGLSACDGRDPTLLADMGEVSVSVGYNAFEAHGPGTADVYLKPAEGCPTFIGDATLNGAALTVEDPGHTEASDFYGIPGERCVTPHFAHGTLDIASDEALELVLTDDSATWTVVSDGAFEMRWTAPTTTAAPGDTLQLAWSGPAVPDDVFVDAWRDGLGVYTPYDIDGDGNVAVQIPADLAPGALRVDLTAWVGFAPDTCDGFASCTLTARFEQDIDVVVE